MNSFFQKRTRPMIIAHRGASADAPENTLAAFNEAIRQKADAIELDVQLTRDRKLVIIHDPTLNRTTTGQGLVNTKTLQEIKRLDAGTKFSQYFKDESVPTLDEVFKAFGKQTSYVVELKFYHLQPTRFAHQVYATASKYNLINKILFLSFDPRLLLAIKKIDPNAKTCWVFIPIFQWRPPRWAITHFDALAIAARQANSSYIQRLHNLDKPINLWTNSGTKRFTTDIQSGANFITTNHPAKLRQALNKTIPS